MDITLNTIPESNDLSWFKRPRLDQLLAEAIKCPLVIVCAGAGYGKTRAVADFLARQDLLVAWEQLSDRDNVSARGWENLTHSFARMNGQLGEVFRESGFPDTEEKCKQFYRLYERNMLSKRQYIVVLDDFHFLKTQAVLDFVKYAINYSSSHRKAMIIISREPLPINLANLHARNLVAYLYEEDLNFNERELAQYMSNMGLSVGTQTLREIFQDTKGWAFAVNFIAQSLKKSPNYSGYVRSAMRKNFFHLMEIEVFNAVSDRLRRLFACLSLVDHLSADLVAVLAEGDKSLLAELERQSAYVRFDSYINAYLIHHQFLDFLRTKQDVLTEEEKRRTYRLAADWCNRNDFKMDALAYYEKIGDYGSIVSIMFDLPEQLPDSIAHFAEQIFNRAPADACLWVVGFVGTHVRIINCLGKWRESLDLIARYEAELLRLPEDDKLRNRNLGGLYYAWAALRQMLCTTDDRYDFHVYYARMNECLTKSPAKPQNMNSHAAGSWISFMGSARQGAPEEYIDALARSAEHASHCFNGCMAGIDDLARGEFRFYQGDVRAAESFIIKGIEKARAFKQYELAHRGLLYMIHVAVAQGDFAKAEKALKDSEAMLDETEFLIRFQTYDITLGMYYILALRPEMVPSWLKEAFSPYGHPKFIENLANQVKLHYCYATNKYASMLSYIKEQKKRDLILYGRVELQAMEACAFFKTKDRTGALSALREAYETALPNNIMMPFIRLGKDMRTLASAALRETGCAIPNPWLETIVHKATSYGKRHAQFLLSYKRVHGAGGDEDLSSREKEVLRDIYHGLSRSEIATNLDLSSNTVKLYINNIYGKLKARNLADVIRIAAERKLV